MSNSSSDSDFTAKLSDQVKHKKSNNIFFAFWLGCFLCLGFGVGFGYHSFLMQAGKAREQEGSTTVGAILRGQQVYILEEKAFASNIEQLGIGIQACSASYCFPMKIQSDGLGVIVTAMPHYPSREKKYYTGVIFVVADTQEDIKTKIQVCKSAEKLTSVPTLNLTTVTIDCPTDSEAI